MFQGSIHVVVDINGLFLFMAACPLYVYTTLCFSSLVLFSPKDLSLLEIINICVVCCLPEYKVPKDRDFIYCCGHSAWHIGGTQ